MLELIKQNPKGVIIALFGGLSGITLLIFAMVFIYYDYKGRINKDVGEFKEHLIIGVSSIFMGISVYLTDLSDGIDIWIQNLEKANGIMILQYLFGGILSLSLIYHLIKRHYDKH